MKKLHRRLLAVGLLAMIMIFVALFSWRYQTLNAPLAHPAVKTRSLSLPAKVVLHRRTVSLEKVEATIVHGQWRVRYLVNACRTAYQSAGSLHLYPPAKSRTRCLISWWFKLSKKPTKSLLIIQHCFVKKT